MIKIAAYDIGKIAEEILCRGNHVIAEFKEKQLGLFSETYAKTLTIGTSANDKEFTLGALIDAPYGKISPRRLKDTVMQDARFQGFEDLIVASNILIYTKNQDNLQDKSAYENSYSIHLEKGRTVIMAGHEHNFLSKLKPKIKHPKESFHQQFSNVTNLTEIILNMYEHRPERRELILEIFPESYTEKNRMRARTKSISANTGNKENENPENNNPGEQ
ncbi:MAG: hypothetical protein Q8O89_01900 [Nanoarchaeota archaeon]|nr:hypothetical protein [Nanoarchaeota archaeon]